MSEAGLASAPCIKGIVLFAHGSRDPLWRAPVEAVAARLRARAPALAVACAYLELNEPDLPAAVAAMAEAGCTRVHVLPLFLGVGRHAREDLPRLLEGLRQQYPALQLTLAPAVGENPAVLDLLADLALAGVT